MSYILVDIGSSQIKAVIAEISDIGRIVTRGLGSASVVSSKVLLLRLIQW